MIKFKFSDIGEGLHQGDVAEVFVKVGDTIKEGDPLFSVETDKLTSEIPAPADGKITKVFVEEGKTVHVGEEVVWIDDGKGDASSASEETTGSAPKPEATKPVEVTEMAQDKVPGKQYSGEIAENYDVIIVGAGPAGYIAAEEAGKNGKKTLLVEKKFWGGVCLNVGCIPTKALLHAAHEIDFAKHAVKAGIIANFKNIKIDYEKTWKNIHKKKEAVVKQIVGGVKFLMKSSKVKTIEAEAKLVGAHEIEVQGKVYRGTHLIWASGSRDRKLTLPGFEKGYQNGVVLTSKEAINFSEKYAKSLVIIGGGVIGLEFAQIFSSAKTKVTILQNSSSVLSPLISPAIKKVITTQLEENGVTFVFNADVKKLSGNTLHYEVDGKAHKIEAEHILTSVGRIPNTEGLKEVGVTFDYRGLPLVDESFMSAVQNLYIAGDVSAKAMLAHVAYRQSYEILSHILKLEKIYKKQAVPGAIYTHPEIAFAGLSEKEAKDQGYKVIVGRYSFGFLGRAVATGENEGLIELYVNKENGALLGAQIIGANASDFITELVLAMDNEISIFEIAATIHPHPSYSEIIWEAARGVALKLHNLIQAK